VNYQVGLEAAQLRPGGRLVTAGQRVREQLEVEAFPLLQFLQDGNRFLAERIVDVKEGDLLALQTVA
jgi:hypothetical protein